MYTLYYSPRSASMVVHLALLEIGAPYELRLVDTTTEDTCLSSYLQINPRGSVPTLIIDGRPISESVALLMVLAERHPEATLAPALSTPERKIWLQWITYLSQQLMPVYKLWFFPALLGMTKHTPEVRAALQRRIEKAWDILEEHLAANGPYLLGEQFSGADLLLAMLTRWSRETARPTTEWSRLTVLEGLVRARSSWQVCCKIEGIGD
jgi:glutathione S-transferase